MKTKIFTSFIALLIGFLPLKSQESISTDRFGKALNIGLGTGHYGYVDHFVPGININYEFDALRNFTLAPSISWYNNADRYYWGDKNRNYPFRYYDYSETVIPIAVKGSYYFDELLNANSKWDFYAAGSLGFVIISTSWESDYYGDRNAHHRRQFLFLSMHIGAEYHFNNHLGMFLDLSSGMSTVGIAIH